MPERPHDEIDPKHELSPTIEQFSKWYDTDGPTVDTLKQTDRSRAPNTLPVGVGHTLSPEPRLCCTEGTLESNL